MEKELINYIRENNLSPFNKLRTQIRSSNNTIFKTKDAKAVYSKVLSSISKHFIFTDTSNILLNFSFTNDSNEILKRQEFFKSIPQNLENTFLREINLTKSRWKPPYGIVVVTEDEKTFVALQKLNCPVKILLNEQDVRELEEMDIVQVIDCENYSQYLEKLSQTVFLSSIDEAYLERYVEVLSNWSQSINLLKEVNLGEQTNELVNEILLLLPLLDKQAQNKITREQVEDALDIVRDDIGQKVKEMTVSGNSLMEVLSRGALPQELKVIVQEAIQKTNLPRELFLQNIPVQIDEQELEKVIRKQSLTEFTQVAERIKQKSNFLIQLPKKLKQLEERILFYDFISGVSRWMNQKGEYPVISQIVHMRESKNLFLDKPQPITFNLSKEHRCSILTGANSGGKTTLLEHLLQSISCLQLGLPCEGNFSSPLFSEIYYFAKNKGSMSKGAFETLLTQMSQITPGEQTLILADEIEAVTEPGVAGKMISATAQYFLNKNCFLVIATHLGHEIQKNLPLGARIDGIEAVGLDDQNELIVNHNPVIGKLAHSTPELIIEKMVKTQGGDYFNFLHEQVKKSANF